MSFKKMLTDKCDIYKLKASTTSVSYGVPVDSSFEYDVPILGIACSVRRGRVIITQADPFNSIAETLTAYFETTVEVGVNDKIVFNGTEYLCGVPVNVRNHHIEVEIVRKS